MKMILKRGSDNVELISLT